MPWRDFVTFQLKRQFPFQYLLFCLENDPNCQMGDNLYSFLELISEEVNYLISEYGLWIA
jgi:hypothetical protein